jgi:hypothetical protein
MHQCDLLLPVWAPVVLLLAMASHGQHTVIGLAGIPSLDYLLTLLHPPA